MMPMTLALSFERKKIHQSHIYNLAVLASPYCICKPTGGGVSVLCPWLSQSLAVCTAA